MIRENIRHDGFCPLKYEDGLEDIYNAFKKAHERGVKYSLRQIIDSVSRKNEEIREMMITNRYLTIVHDIMDYKTRRGMVRKDLSKRVA
jgi:hypothetical protein